MTDRPRKYVLVVEDEGVVAMDLQRTLAMFGYGVLKPVASAAAALQSAAEHRPDLVLMDIRIRGAMDGIETANILRRRFDVPVVYLTAHADEATLARAKLTEPYGYLLKPVKPDELRSTVAVALYKHEMETRIRERERWFATTLRSIGDAVISTDTEGRVTFMNPVAERLTGMGVADALHQPIVDVLHWTDTRTGRTTDHPLMHVLQSLKLVELDGTILDKDGNEYAVSDSTAPIVTDSGQLLGAVIVFRDVGEKRKLQRQLELADRLTSLGTMAASVCHEINNPLTFLLGNLELALERIDRAGDPTLRAELSRLLEPSRLGAERVSQIVANLRRFSHPIEEAEVATKVADAVEWAVHVATPTLRDHARLRRDITDVPAVSADETRLSQVFINLLINAAHAIPAGQPDQNEVFIRAFTDPKGWVVVEISDTGSGMTKEVQDHIFEPFFTTKPRKGGSGLGLSVCHGIVGSLGGSIEVESALGRGTCFRVRLPPAPWTGDQPRAEQRATDRVPVPGRILIVDDEDLIRSLSVEVLRADAHELTECASAAEALALLASGLAFDLIVCDLMMPDMDGVQLYESLLLRDPQHAMRMLFVSGGACSTRTVEFMQSIERPHLTKPYTPAQLRSTVAKLLHEWGPAKSAGG